MSNPLLTKLGFSKSGFSSCNYFYICDSGKKECYLNEIDLEVKECCRCYQRHHPKVKSSSDATVSIKQDLQQKEEAYVTESDGQISLF